MRAKFIYEKFNKDSDPISDLGIGAAKHLEAIRNAIQPDDEDDFEITWDIVNADKEELTLRAEAHDFYDRENFHPKGKRAYDWREVGVHEGFEWTYYIDVILRKNQVIRTCEFSNGDIDNFKYLDEKILCDDVFSKSAEEIAQIIYKDLDNYDISDAAEEAWDIAESENYITQKRIQ
jgi:hypothetical protein